MVVVVVVVVIWWRFIEKGGFSTLFQIGPKLSRLKILSVMLRCILIYFHSMKMHL